MNAFTDRPSDVPYTPGMSTVSHQEDKRMIRYTIRETYVGTFSAYESDPSYSWIIASDPEAAVSIFEARHGVGSEIRPGAGHKPAERLTGYEYPIAPEIKLRVEVYPYKADSFTPYGGYVEAGNA